MRRRFFVEGFRGGSAVVRGEAAEHLGRVLRAEPGQLYELSDGEKVWLARVDTVTLPKRGESRIEFALVEPVAIAESRTAIHLLISLIKFDRFEWCLEKATELGASEIVPLAAARSDRPLVEAAEKRRARWERILLESAQQARRLRPPVLLRTVRAIHAFTQTGAACKIVLSERAEAPRLRNVLAPGAEFPTIALAIGPEGGWTSEEIDAARQAGFSESSLGKNILRTETAVIASMAVVRFAME
jgi:16S rRNA (uracil1498-N3)-methyltransferase